jgi:hypothetical protein
MRNIPRRGCTMDPDLYLGQYGHFSQLRRHFYTGITLEKK